MQWRKGVNLYASDDGLGCGDSFCMLSAGKPYHPMLRTEISRSCLCFDNSTSSNVIAIGSSIGVTLL